MFIADHRRHFFHAEARVFQQGCGLQQSLFQQKMTKLNPGLLLEQMLQVGVAQVEFLRQLMNAASRLGLDQFQDPANAIFFRGKN